MEKDVIQSSPSRQAGDPPSAWNNYRVTVRYRCAPATPGRLLLTEDKEYQRGWVLNLSRGGLGLQLARQVEVGVLAMIQIRGNVSKKLYELPAHVAHCTHKPNGDWIAGLEFTHQLAEEDLDDLLS